MSFWRPVAGGVRVAVKVQPKSRRPGVGGRAPDVEGTRLRIGVTEAAKDGRANRAALAQALDIKPATISVTQGATSRDKTLLVMDDAATLAARLEAL